MNIIIVHKGHTQKGDDSLMKKSFAIILLIILLIPLVASAASNQPTGTWVSYDKGNMSVYTFNANKKGSYTVIFGMNGNSPSISTMQGTWSMKGNRVYLKIKQGKIDMGGGMVIVIDAQTLQFTYSNGTLKQNASGEYLVKVTK